MIRKSDYLKIQKTECHPELVSGSDSVFYFTEKNWRLNFFVDLQNDYLLNLNVMDKVLTDFMEEKKRKHLEYLGLYKNCDEEVREIQNKINEIKQPLCDLQRINLLLGKCKNGDEGRGLRAINDIDFSRLKTYIDNFFNYEEHSIFEDEDKIKDEKKAYDYFINIQKEYIESILNQLDQIINDSINKEGIKVKTLKKIYDSLKYYRPIDFDKVPQIRQRLKELDGKLKNYYNRNGHWYEKNEPLVLIEISPSDYEELCKKFPPYLMEIEGFVRETYKNGYDKGHTNGYDEGYGKGYKDGYDEGYSMG